MLVVGAPRGNSTYPEHRGVYEPGVVYQCGLDRGNNCQHIVLASKGNIEPVDYNSPVRPMRENSWLGGAIAVQDNGERFVACAPRWRNSYYRWSDYSYFMNGACYLTDTSESRKETILPLNDINKQTLRNYYLYLYGEAGFTAHFPKNSTEILLGAPGIYNWQGAVIRIRDRTFYDIRRGMQTERITDIPTPLNSLLLSTNGYFGYSVSSGRFLSARSSHLYVAGSPRNAQFRGKVCIFDFPLRSTYDLQYIRDLDGTQMGEYFGGALCVVDLNGDRLDDLVVAAPQFSLQATNSAKLVGDEGRIYVFINGDNGKFKEITGDRMIMGNRRYGARFGTAVANVGDLNMDGYEDIAVGAPYEGSGVVFIYHGDKTGIVFEPVQKIFAEKIDPGLNGFGISLSGGVDVDGNHYNDVAVGAFESGHAVVLRGHPIITFHPELTTSTSRISLKTSNFSSRACLSYKGSYVPETADAKVTMTVDLSYGRAHFISEELKISNNYTYEVRLRSESPQCKDFYIAIRPSSKDPTRPIDVVMKYELVNNPNEDTHNSGSDGFCMDCPVVDVRQPTYIIKRVAFETGCKRDICEPDLVADARFIGIKEKFVLGEQTTLQMEVEVQNIGEPAFLARLVLVIPRVTPLVRIPPNCQDSTEKHATEVQTLVCDIGNPLEKNNTIIVVMNTQDIPVDTTSLVFSINATSVGNESTAVDNYKKLVLPIVIQADMTITGLSSQDQIVYVAQNKSFRDDLILSHSFEVWNLGPSNVETVTIEFEIPHQLDGPNGETIFMQVFEPQLSMTASSGTITCGPEDPFFYYKSDETSKGEVSIEIDPTTFKEDDGPDSNVVKSSVVSKRSVSDDEFPPSSPNFVPPPSNRTLFLNCSSQKVDCFKVKCLAGPFTPIKSRATINFKLKPILQTLETSLDNKDIILFSSRGKVSILSPPGSMQQIDHKPDGVTVHTVFHGKIPEGSIATWIIVLAIICGILILFFIAMALHKMGFFKREKKEELEALKEAEGETAVADDGE